MYLTHTHYPLSISTLCALLLSNTSVSMFLLITDCLSFSNHSIYLYSLLFFSLLEVNGGFQSVRAEWMITVEDRGGCSSYKHHLYSVNSAASQFASASFLSSLLLFLHSCAFFLTFFHLSPPPVILYILSCLCTAAQQYSTNKMT